MVPTGNLASTGGTEETPKPVDKTETAFRPVTPVVRDDRQGPKFKEVLSKKLSKDKDETSTVASTDEEEGEESISPLTLAAQAPVKKIKSVKDALDAPTDEVEETVIEEPAASKPKKIEVAAVVPDAPKVVDTAGKKTKDVEIPLVKTTVDAHVKVGTEKDKGPEIAFVATEKGDKGKLEVVEDVVVVKTGDTTSKPIVETAVPKEVPGDVPKEKIVGKIIEKVPEKVVDKVLEKIVEKVPEKVVEQAGPAAINVPKEKPVEVVKVKNEEQLVAQVNLAAVPQHQVETGVSAAIQKVPDEVGKAREVLIKLAEQMIERLDRITTPERTDTTIKLQYPPLFNGAELVVTEFKIAQRQFNITFSHLSPEAQAMIAMQQNQGELRQALIDKGYTLQMITIKQDIPGLGTLSAGETSAEKRDKGDKQQASGEDTGALR